MIKFRDIMLCNPAFIKESSTIGQVRVVAKNTRFKSVPVLDHKGQFIGSLDFSLASREELPGDSTVLDFIKAPLASVYECDSISCLRDLNIDSETSLIPVLSKQGSLVGTIPDPLFFQNIFTDLLEYLGEKQLNQVRVARYGIIIIDDEGRIITFNTNAEKILGLKGKHVYGIHINKVLYHSRLCEVVKKGKPQLNTKLEANQVTLCTSRFPLYKGSTIIGAVGIFDEVSEHENLQENLRQMRKVNLEMVHIMESLSDGVAVFDQHGTLIKTNSAFEQFIEMPVSHILQANLSWLIQNDCIPELVATELFQKKTSLRSVETVRGKECLLIGNPIFNGDGKLVRVVVIIKDVNKVYEIITNLQIAQELADRYCQTDDLLSDQEIPDNMIASSLAMRQVVFLAHKVAKVDSNVLIMGETGVGKEVVARSIHQCSRRMDGPFIKLNCGAIPEQLLESELFGYESGAFTGAKKEGKAGLIELADDGTLFLDEVGDLPLSLQVKLLRVLQEREVMRVGGTKTKKVDFRLIAATNRDLEVMVKENTFREDLYYRLNVVPVHIPALRERKEDILPLTIFILNKFNKKYGMNKKISPEVIQSLLKYDWPGNIRELENTIERLVVTSEHNLVLGDDLKGTRFESKEEDLPLLAHVLENTEKSILYEAFQRYGTTREMAEALGISQSAVVKKMKKYKITRAQTS